MMVYTVKMMQLAPGTSLLWELDIGLATFAVCKNLIKHKAWLHALSKMSNNITYSLSIYFNTIINQLTYNAFLILS
jgi:hypothetical protein